MALGITVIMEEKFKKVLNDRLSEMEFKQPTFIQIAVENAITNWWAVNKNDILKDIKNGTQAR